MPLDYVIYVDVPENKLQDRLTGRRVCPKCGATYHVEYNPPKVAETCDNDQATLIQREDDQPETVAKRLKVNVEETQDRKNTRLNSRHLAISYPASCVTNKTKPA